MASFVDKMADGRKKKSNSRMYYSQTSKILFRLIYNSRLIVLSLLIHLHLSLCLNVPRQSFFYLNLNFSIPFIIKYENVTYKIFKVDVTKIWYCFFIAKIKGQYFFLKINSLNICSPIDS